MTRITHTSFRDAEIGHREWVRDVQYTLTRAYFVQRVLKRAWIMLASTPRALMVGALAGWVAFEAHIDSELRKESDQ